VLCCVAGEYVAFCFFHTPLYSDFLQASKDSQSTVVNAFLDLNLPLQMDADYDPTQQRVKTKKKKKKGKGKAKLDTNDAPDKLSDRKRRRSKFAEALYKPKPQFDPSM